MVCDGRERKEVAIEVQNPGKWIWGSPKKSSEMASILALPHSSCRVSLEQRRRGKRQTQGFEIHSTGSGWDSPGVPSGKFCPFILRSRCNVRALCSPPPPCTALCFHISKYQEMLLKVMPCSQHFQALLSASGQSASLPKCWREKEAAIALPSPCPQISTTSTILLGIHITQQGLQTDTIHNLFLKGCAI